MSIAYMKTIKIVVKELYSRVLSKDPVVLAVVRNVCSARPEGYQFMSKYRSGRWDGYISLVRGLNTFPTGLLRLVCDELERSKVDVECDYAIKHIQPGNDISNDMLQGITLRDYQVTAIKQLLRGGRGIAKMATNSGKTAVIAGLIKAYENFHSVVLLHRKELLHQTRERLAARLGVSVGDIGAVGDGMFLKHRVTVAMVQTLYNRRKDIPQVFAGNFLVLVDECHHVSSNQMMDVLFAIPGPIRIGFSGTPLVNRRLADLKLIAATGPVVVDISNKELISSGVSATPDVTIHTVYDDDADLFELDYAKAYAKAIVNNDERNAIISNIAHVAAGGYGIVLVLVTRIAHGNILSNMIPGSIFVHGSCSVEERREALDNMRRDDFTGVVIASQIFDEGVDVPCVDTVVLAGGGKSQVKLLQRIGRGLRAKKGRNVVVVHDFLDDTNKYLLNHSERRIDVYEQEGFSVTLVE